MFLLCPGSAQSPASWSPPCRSSQQLLPGFLDRLWSFLFQPILCPKARGRLSTPAFYNAAPIVGFNSLVYPRKFHLDKVLFASHFSSHCLPAQCVGPLSSPPALVRVVPMLSPFHPVPSLITWPIMLILQVEAISSVKSFYMALLEAPMNSGSQYTHHLHYNSWSRPLHYTTNSGGQSLCPTHCWYHLQHSEQKIVLSKTRYTRDKGAGVVRG